MITAAPHYGAAFFMKCLDIFTYMLYNLPEDNHKTKRTDTMARKKIILASKSARRRELLEMLGTEFEIITKDTDESGVKFSTPDELVKQLSLRKLEAVIGEVPDGSVVISADTIVWCGGEVYGKPKDTDDARRMLRSMSGHAHQVYTGISVSDGEKTVTDAVCSDVYFRNISDREIDDYVTNCAVTDKAGAYGIQERASLFVERIDGDYFNIVGLPVCRLGEIMREEFGIDL